MLSSKNVFSRQNIFTFKTCIAILLIIIVLSIIIGLSFVNFSSKQPLCPVGYQDHPLLLISLDGFRPEYLGLGVTPTLNRMLENGVSAPFIVSSYPTNTFPNHYSIATGLYPESHGIIDSRFYDPEFNDIFSRKTDTLYESRWWGGEPIWNTLRKQGKISATYFWVGSDTPIGGTYPNYYKKYNHSTPFEDRVDQVIRWLSLPAEMRPIWLSLYFNEPDSTGHKYGPNSMELKQQVARVDAIIERLLDGLKNIKLTQCVNIIIVSDHGMAARKNSPPLDIIFDGITDTLSFSPKSYERFNIIGNSTETKKRVEKKLSCDESFKLYHKNDLPQRLHFTHNSRIHDYVLLYADGIIPMRSDGDNRQGEHGYDNLLPSMRAIFIGHGPDFKKNTTIEPFQNIELYNLMCNLVGVNPAPNNGTSGALHEALMNHPGIKSEAMILKNPVTVTLDKADSVAKQEFFNLLNISNERMREVTRTEVPFGVAKEYWHQSDALRLLYHPTHITGYSQKLQLPTWTSFSLNGEIMLNTSLRQWQNDIRGSLDMALKCSPLNETFNHRGRQYSYQPLFNPRYSEKRSLEHLSFLTTNAIPISSNLMPHWRSLHENFIPRWVNTQGPPLNVLLGSVFDDELDPTSGDLCPVPSSLFAAVTRCKKIVPAIHLCPHADLDVLSFIFPQGLRVPTCYSDAEFLKTYISTLRDIERASGLSFFTELRRSVKLKLSLRIQTELWQ